MPSVQHSSQRPDWPRRLPLRRFARYECFGRSYNLTFRKAGRFFQVQVAFGRAADRATRATTLRVLNTLTVG